MNLSVRHRDFLTVVVVVLATYLLSLFFNGAELINAALSKYEDVQLDEVPLALFVFALMSAWFSGRRVKELILETNLRKVVEGQLQDSQLLYKSFFDGDLTGNCVLSVDGSILMTNSGFNKICNLPAHQQSAHHLFDFDWQSFINTIMEAKELNYKTLTIHRTDKMPCIVIARFVYAETYFRTKPEHATQIHAYLVDITELHLTERDLERTLKENQNLARHAINIQEKERKFIAQEIHDETGQYLTAIRMDALALQKMEPHKMLEIAARIANNTSHVQKTIHALIKQLRPITLDSHGLANAIQQLVQEWRQQNTVMYLELDLSLGDYNFIEEVNIVTFRIVQEALTNIAKHAHASNVRIKVNIILVDHQPNLLIEVQDNGKGLDFTKPKGLGLVGMRERVESLSGIFSINSEIKVGTCITAQIPILSTQSTSNTEKVIYS